MLFFWLNSHVTQRELRVFSRRVQAKKQKKSQAFFLPGQRRT
jgi:hypothetical protein